MKIGIFGDSFAENNPNLMIASREQGLEFNEERLSWIDHLKKMNSEKVISHGMPGSNLYYSYEQFIKYHDFYDTIVFTITNYSRFLWLPQLQTIHPFIPGIGAIDHYLELCKDEHDLNIVKAAKEYLLWLENPIQLKGIHNLLLNDIQKIRPDAILIPCFGDDNSMPNADSIPMMDIANIDLKFYKFEHYKGFDKKHCHLNDDNNKIFADKIYEYIKGDRSKTFKINITDYVNPNKPVDYYYYTG